MGTSHQPYLRIDLPHHKCRRTESVYLGFVVLEICLSMMYGDAASAGELGLVQQEGSHLEGVVLRHSLRKICPARKEL